MLLTCRTCKYWEQRFNQNAHLGVCRKLGVIHFDRGTAVESVVIVLAFDDGIPTSDVGAVRTRADFGCPKWTAPSGLLSARDLDLA